MNRREFLKLSGMLSAFVLASLSPINVLAKSPVENDAVAIGKKLYRGARNGNIYISQNGGKTWKLQAGFGPNCPILGMTVAANVASNTLNKELEKYSDLIIAWMLESSPKMEKASLNAERSSP